MSHSETNPCWHCEERSATCHSKCEAYKDWWLEHEEYKRQKREHDEKVAPYVIPKSFFKSKRRR